MFEDKNMIDTFRLLHPGSEKFSRFGIQTEDNIRITNMSRIDQAWISESLVNKISYADIIEDEILIADHRIIVKLYVVL